MSGPVEAGIGPAPLADVVAPEALEDLAVLHQLQADGTLQHALKVLSLVLKGGGEGGGGGKEIKNGLEKFVWIF